MMDKEKIQQGIQLILEGIGEDTEREGLIETPDRIYRMYEEIFAGYSDDAKTHLAKRFKVDDSDMVIVKDISFYSMCEHHMMPFFGTADVAYIPGGEVVGLSKIARTVEVFARRLQIQERMGAQIADALSKELNTRGVMVKLQAEHTCMTMRGVKKPGSKTVTYATRGVFSSDESIRKMFLDSLG